MFRLRASLDRLQRSRRDVTQSKALDDEPVQAALLKQQRNDSAVGAGVLGHDLDATERLVVRERDGLPSQRRTIEPHGAEIGDAERTELKGLEFRPRWCFVLVTSRAALICRSCDHVPLPTARLRPPPMALSDCAARRCRNRTPPAGRHEATGSTCHVKSIR